MPYDPTPRVIEIIERIDAFMEEVGAPLEERLYEGITFADLEPDLAEARREVQRRGLWNPHLPEDLGGLGLPLMEFVHVAERLGRSPIGPYLFNFQAPDVGNQELLAEFGTDAQKERFLAPLLRGEIRSCFTMTEPERAGSNPTWLQTTAVRDGAQFVLDGRKWFASSADGAAFAVAMVVTDPEAQRHRRASMILVPTDTPGYRLVRNLRVMGDEGSGWMSHGEVVYEDCRVPVENLLGPQGAGFALAQARLGPGRIHHCMRWIGICERAFEMMVERLVTREIAPGESLGTKQILRGYVAECRANIDAARLYVLDTAHKVDTVGAKAARVQVSAIKFFVANVLDDVLDKALQVHGGAGMLDDLPIAFWYRHERAARIYDGADEVHKSYVGRKVLEAWAKGAR